MTIYYRPRVTSDESVRARIAENAKKHGLTLCEDGKIPASCLVLIAYERYTSDYSAEREKKLVVYTRHTGTRTYRAAYATLEAAVAGARKIEMAYQGAAK
jgi:hypothetical protein